MEFKNQTNNESLKLLKSFADIVQNGSNEDILSLDTLIQSVHSKAKDIKSNILRQEQEMNVKYPIAQNVTDAIANYYASVLKRMTVTYLQDQPTEQEIDLVSECLQDYLRTPRGQKDLYNGGDYTNTIHSSVRKVIDHTYSEALPDGISEVDKQKVDILSDLLTKLENPDTKIVDGFIKTNSEGISISEGSEQIISMTLDGQDKLNMRKR